MTALVAGLIAMTAGVLLQQPRLSLSDRRLEPGTTVRLTGSGFQPGTRPTVALETSGDTVELGFLVPSPGGAVEAPLDIPGTLPPGAGRLVARVGDAVVARLDVALLEPAPASAPDRGPGSDAARPAMAGHDMPGDTAAAWAPRRLLGYDWPLLHAALNDLPSALLVFALLFEVGALITGRESLRAAGFWTLVAGVAGMAAAAGAGLMAEGRVAHDDVAHEVMNRHKLLAIIALVLFTVLLAWRLIRRSAARLERIAWAGGAAIAVALLVLASQLGGTLVFEHALGVPSPTLHTVLERRGDMPAMVMPDSNGADSTAGATPVRPHRDRPGAAPHAH